MNLSNCVICGKAIRGVFFTTEQNERFCGDHTDPARCRYCLHLLKRGDSEPCSSCLKYGFGDIQQAQGSIARVLTWLENHTGVHQFQRVPVNLTDGVHFGPNQSGLTNWRFDGYRLDVDVEMLRHSQANTFEPTLAHEYGHVLLVANPNDLSFTGGMGQARLQEEEGFCEVLRYLWISETGGSNKHLELQAIKDNRDSLYGDGFRMMWPEFKSAGSIMNLRADLLGIPRPNATKNSGSWIFGKKKTPKAPPTPDAVQPPSPPAPPSIPTPQPGTVIEGGSHRPILNLNLDQTIQKPAPTAPPVLTDAQRPTIDLSQPASPASPPRPAPASPDSERPIITFD